MTCFPANLAWLWCPVESSKQGSVPGADGNACELSLISRRIRKYLTRQSTETLVHAFVTSRLDYCNGILYGLPHCLLNKLQRVQNACARLSFKEKNFAV